MPDIDVSKIKPGDTVRVRVRTRAMRERDIDPYEFTSQAYRHFNRDATLPCSAGGFALDITDDVTVLEHIPTRPDWADARVIRSEGEGEVCFYLKQHPPQGDGFVGSDGEVWDDWRDLEHYQITVVLDADGNPPTPELIDEAKRLRAIRDAACELARELEGGWHGFVVPDIIRAEVEKWTPEGDR